MKRPKLKLIEESIFFVADIYKLRATIEHLIKYIRHLEETREFRIKE